MRPFREHQDPAAALAVALGESSARLGAAFEFAAIGMAFSALDGRWLRANPAFCAIVGYSEEELVGLSFQSITHPADLGGSIEALEKLLSGEIPSYSAEKRYVRKDGSFVWVLLTVSVVRGADGAPVHFIAQVQDVSARKLAEQELAQSRALLQAIVDHAPAAICVKDRRGSYELVNRTWERYTELSREAVLGRSDDALFPPAVAGAFRANDARALAGETVDIEESLDGPSEPRSFRAIKFPMRDGTGEVFALGGIITETTAQKALEARIVKSERLAALGTMTAGIAHEMNNPLSYALGNTTFALEELEALDAALRELGARPGPEELEGIRARLPGLLEAVQEARHGAERVARIVGQLRSVGRQCKAQVGKVDLAPVVANAAKLAASEVAFRARLRVEAAPGHVVDGDEGQLVQVFVNLLVNAAQAIDEGAPERNEVAVVVGRLDPHHVFVDVKDTGRGMEPELAGRIFDPFFTTKGVGAGMGLGLSVCDGIVSAHRGRIDVRTEVGCGSTFRVVLPSERGPIAL